MNLSRLFAALPMLLLISSFIPRDAAADMTGLRGPDGVWYCNTGYVAAPEGCVQAPQNSTSVQQPAKIRVEYGPDSIESEKAFVRALGER
jgi:hypothetical protein